MSEYDQLIDWAFKALLGGSLGYGVYALGQMKSSVEQLNITVAVAIERMSHQDKRLDVHEKRLDKLEEK